jgi:RNA polymerase sigma factor (sigma-70 family)
MPLIGVELADLVRGAKQGDAMAMTRLLDALAPYVGRICGAIALDAGEDAAQETLLTVFRRLGSLRDPDALYGWVRTIAVREGLRAARGAAPPATTGDIPIPAPHADPTLGDDIRCVLERLSPEHRAILVLRDLHGIDEATAAGLLGVARGTVKSRLHRARALFRRKWAT